MALKTVISFPIFAPIPTTITTSSSTELRFARWNNANAEKFELNRRTQQQIEDDLRRFRRFESALNISNTRDDSTSESSNPRFKSIGTPSIPSISSIPGKKSKYSKPRQNPNPNSGDSKHPAFRKMAKRVKFPRESEARVIGGETDIRVGENGLTYVVPGAPFEFMYSYTETPKNVRPIGPREPAITPFGPDTMPRPWTGRKPLSKKELPEFDSFKVPEPGKRGVKPVQKPGPFLPGSGPKYVMSREEVLGEPLTEEEVADLLEGCRKTKRQLNMGRDGLTHNMLDNIHAHWKRRRVCKIKCKGVCTVDMDTVCQQLEDKTGGKIIYRRGGVVFLFRGRNYNYRTRPRFPLMLWKPVAPVYPRLVARVPEGLTLEEATDMRRRGRDLTPICKLGKNGVYVNLAKHVREAFEACELVRINCQGMNPSDCRKIGAKLKDLVPCVLISFENEHILMWRGKEWKSSILLPEDGAKIEQSTGTESSKSHDTYTGNFVDSEDEEDSSNSSEFSNQRISAEMPNLSEGLTDDLEVGVTEAEDKSKDDASTLKVNVAVPLETSDLGSEIVSDPSYPSGDRSSHDENQLYESVQSGLDVDETRDLEVSAENFKGVSDTSSVNSGANSQSASASSCTEGVLDLLRQAVESGSAVILDDSSLDADMVYERSVAVAQVAPPGPVFKHCPPKVTVQKSERRTFVRKRESKRSVKKSETKKSQDSGAEEAVPVAGSVYRSNEKKFNGRKSSRTHTRNNVNQESQLLDLVPQGSLEVDELAKLLA